MKSFSSVKTMFLISDFENRVYSARHLTLRFFLTSVVNLVVGIRLYAFNCFLERILCTELREMFRVLAILR